MVATAKKRGGEGRKYRPGRQMQWSSSSSSYCCCCSHPHDVGADFRERGEWTKGNLGEKMAYGLAFLRWRGRTRLCSIAKRALSRRRFQFPAGSCLAGEGALCGPVVISLRSTNSFRPRQALPQRISQDVGVRIPTVLLPTLSDVLFWFIQTTNGDSFSCVRVLGNL
ncbi:hypothetical protein Taro_049293 [Colocasia esculenta]|uniref:Uncharacterized protein n=1 Tax=Colocasia esculenta TaxID=4460 RepID=A0A843XAJ3_COLES|nr:hypothetical protein [Colocasia esculenta]